MNTKKKTLPTICQTFIATTLAICFPAIVLSQTQISTTDTPEKEVVVLSPFEVNVDRDTGFVAASSLAGGRLAGDLKNTPVAYSVLTKEFIDALQLTDVNSMAAWAPNNSSREENGGDVVAPNGTGVQISTRGIHSPQPQRNFFPYPLNFDSYNIERLDFARGANSILFGAGGVGGNSNVVSKQARLDKSFTEVRASYGSWDNYRIALDHNEVLGRQFALRLNGVYQDKQKGWMDRDFDEKKAATLAATWKPFRRTEVRAEAEIANRERAVITTNFDDYFTAWSGTATYSAPITAWNYAQGISRTGRMPVYTPSFGQNTLMNYENWAATIGGNYSAATPINGILVVGPTAGIHNNPIEGENLPAYRFDRALQNSHFVVPSREASTSVDAPLWGQDYYNMTLAVTQQIGRSFFIEAAFNYSKEDNDSNFMPIRGQGRIYIDVNSKLPSGINNPNFLEPYGESPSYQYNRVTERTNGRVALGYVLDNTRFGTFQFNAIGGISNSDQSADSLIYVLKTHADPKQWPTYDQVRYRYYYNTDVSRPMPRPDSWMYVDPIAKTSKSVPAGLVRDYTNSGMSHRTETTYTYGQAAVTAKLLKERINFLAAVRYDKYETTRESLVERQDIPANWNGSTFFAKPAAPSDWKNLTYRERNSSGIPFGPVLPATARPILTGYVRDPIYANDRFQDDYSPEDITGNVTTYSVGSVVHVTQQISAFVNYGESFNPPGNWYDIDGKFFEPQASKGWDYGLRFSLFKGSIVANIIRYTGECSHQNMSATKFATPLDAIIKTYPKGGDISMINQRGLYQIGAYVDSSATQTEGWEFEVTANITKNWRLMANAALPESYQTDTYAGTLSYLARNDKTLRLILDDAGVAINANNVASMKPGITATDSPRGPGAVTAWNTIQTELASVVSDPQKMTRVPEVTANIFTDYTFRKGWLRGLRIGGGVNYRGKEVIGYKGADTIRDPKDATRAIDDPSVGALDVVYGRAYAIGTMTLNYSWRINPKITLLFDLKIDNLFDYDRPVYYNTVMRAPNGDITNPARVATPQKYYWKTPRNVTFTVTAKF